MSSNLSQYFIIMVRLITEMLYNWVQGTISDSYKKTEKYSLVFRPMASVASAGQLHEFGDRQKQLEIDRNKEIMIEFGKMNNG